MAIEKRLVSIVGSTYYPGSDVWLAKMAPGQKLRVEREPKSPYDPNAVAVYIFEQQLGHFPRGFAAEVAPLMDAGFKLSATKSRDPRFTGAGVMVVEWEKPDVASADAGEDR